MGGEFFSSVLSTSGTTAEGVEYDDIKLLYDMSGNLNRINLFYGGIQIFAYNVLYDVGGNVSEIQKTYAGY